METDLRLSRRRLIASAGIGVFCFAASSWLQGKSNKVDPQNTINAFFKELSETFPNVDEEVLYRIAFDFEEVNKSIAASPYISGMSAMLGYDVSTGSYVNRILQSLGYEASIENRATPQDFPEAILGAAVAVGFSLSSARLLSAFSSQEGLEEYLEQTYASIPKPDLSGLARHLRITLDNKIAGYSAVLGVTTAIAGPFIQEEINNRMKLG